MRYVLILLLSSLLCACQNTPPLPAWQSPEGLGHPELGEIRDLRSGARLTPGQLLQRLAAAPRVLVGEQHDNPDHHALELWLLRGLAAQRRQGSVLLEMLEPTQQPRVDAARAASRSGRPPNDLYQALAWQRGWDWSLYGPLATWLVQQPSALLAANLDRHEIMDIYRAQPPLEGALSNAESVRRALLEDIREAHCGLLPDSQLPAMLAVQQQRDRRMAERLLQAPAPALLIAGGFHVRRDLGVPLHLHDLHAAAGAQVVLLADVGRQVDAGQADYVWYTPAQPAQDHCAALRARR